MFISYCTTEKSLSCCTSEQNISDPLNEHENDTPELDFIIESSIGITLADYCCIPMHVVHIHRQEY